MKPESDKMNISSEVLAAYLDGNATARETEQVISALSDDRDLRELMAISMAVDASPSFPMAAMAASCQDDNLCCLECEKFILQQRDIPFNDQQMLLSAIDHNWLKVEGTPLHNMGRHLEEAGLAVVRKYNANLNDIEKFLSQGASLMAAVDGGELDPQKVLEEKIEDLIVGTIPDHAVAVVSLDLQNNSIQIFNPDSTSLLQTIPLERFLDAWEDSGNYLVAAAAPGQMEYEPAPLDLSGVELDTSLDELREAIAENAHEVWAFNRKKEGWSYGPRRDDALKQTPDMVPYSQLPESEKQYDREMAINTIKLLKKLGYDIVKK